MTVAAWGDRLKHTEWLVLALVASVMLPWYNTVSLELSSSDISGVSAVSEILAGRTWLSFPMIIIFLLLLLRLKDGRNWMQSAPAMVLSLVAFIIFIIPTFLIGYDGPALNIISTLYPKSYMGQNGLGIGGILFSISLLGLIGDAFAARGFCRGERFGSNAIIFISSLLVVFVFFPIAKLGASAFISPDGTFSLVTIVERVLAPNLWGMSCLVSSQSCGIVINTIILGVLSAGISTMLGLALALLCARTDFRFKGALKAIAILPIITPPFVVGIAIIVLFGRAGIVTGWLDVLFGIPPTRWIYGLPGIVMAQVLSFAPVTFLVLLGAVQAINPTVEEASKTLGAGPFNTFRNITLPLLRPGLAAAFLLAFIESLADFGNPLILGGGYDVLSVRIFFAVVGARYDLGNAATLSMILLSLTLIAFWLQTRWIGKKSYVTITGKSDAGVTSELPKAVLKGVYSFVLPWLAFTFAVYLIVMVGGFVHDIGRWDLTPTFAHLSTAFAVEFADTGLRMQGSAWNSLKTTLIVSAIAAPLTTIIGILTAYLISRQSFVGKNAFEFATMLSFAIPGTVVGVSYVVAFNVPPLDITGTMIILIISFMFRNMAVGVRAGIASLSQIDKSMEEASQTLGAKRPKTLAFVVLPLIKPAIFTSLVYSFVTAMTAVSAVIFLVSARHNMATTYIMGRVETGEYALAIAYSAVLMIIMIAAIIGMNLIVGQRRLGRRSVKDANV